MRVSGVLILVGRLHPEVAPQLKPWVQGILQEELLELLSSWARKAKVGAWFAIPACPLTAGPPPWPKPGTCEFRSLGKKGTCTAIHNVSLRLTEASNTGADYKKKRYMCPKKYLVSCPKSARDRHCKYFSLLTPVGHVDCSAVQLGTEIRQRKLKCFTLQMLAWMLNISPVNSLTSFNTTIHIL